LSRSIGTVQWFDEKKGYGFIFDPEYEKDIFVHYKGIATIDSFKTLFKGQIVSYSVFSSDKGFVATDVRPVIPKESEFKNGDNLNG